MCSQGRSRAAVELSGVERTALQDAACHRNAALSTAARIVLECERHATDTAVAELLGVDTRTIGRWRRRFADEGLGILDRPDGEALILAAINGDGTPGHAPTSQEVAESLGVSQSTVSRAWRTAGVRPTPSGTLIADPWFRGCARVVVGFALAARHNYATSSPIGDEAGPARALVFEVGGPPSDPRRRAAEDGLALPSEARTRVWEEATAWVQAVDDLAKHQREATATSGPDAECQVDLVEFVRTIAESKPGDTQTWVLLDRPPPELLSSWAGEAEVELRYTPSSAVWSALAVRSVAATAMTAMVRGEPSPLAGMETAARRICADTSARRAPQWQEDPARTAHLLDLVGRRVPRPKAPVAARRHRTVDAAMVNLRARRPQAFPTDQPPFEQVVLIRQRADDAGVTGDDVVDAHVVLADLMLTCDLLESAVLGYCRQPFVDVSPQVIAKRLGYTTPHAASQRKRTRAASAAAGRRGSTRTALPDPRETVRLDANGRRRNVVDETITELFELWREDLTGHDSGLSRLPEHGDRFAILGHLVDPARPVFIDWRADQRGPRERHQAAADAGLILLTDLRHRLSDERLHWYRLGIEHGVPWRLQGDPYGRTSNAAVQDWKRMELRTRDPDGESATAAPPNSTWWQQHDRAITATIDALQRHREVVEEDDDLSLYPWMLDEAPTPTRRVTRLITYVEDLMQPRVCDPCTEQATGAPDAAKPLTKSLVVSDEDGRRRCPEHGHHTAFARIVEECMPLVRELRKLRRQSG